MHGAVSGQALLGQADPTTGPLDDSVVLDHACLLEIGQAGCVLQADLGDILTEPGHVVPVLRIAVIGGSIYLRCQLKEEILSGLIQLVPGDAAALGLLGDLGLGFDLNQLGQGSDCNLFADALIAGKDVAVGAEFDAAIAGSGAIFFRDCQLALDDVKSLLGVGAGHDVKGRALCPLYTKYSIHFHKMSIVATHYSLCFNTFTDAKSIHRTWTNEEHAQRR